MTLRFGAIPQQAGRMTIQTWWVYSQAGGEVSRGVQWRRAWESNSEGERLAARTRWVELMRMMERNNHIFAFPPSFYLRRCFTPSPIHR
jgi:hypothetical protein